MDESIERLSATRPSERVLLLSHCLRPSQTCPGKFTKQGLVCPESCSEDCVVGRLSRAALSMGYGGVCTAAGGTQAVRFVAEHAPRGIVAIACPRELAEGVEAVQGMAASGEEPPAIVVVPLSRDGCVDTEVDEVAAMEAISVGCHAIARW
mgnify:CR=1 FL=1